MRVHVDCTFTRLQAAEVGITRVVRGLARGLREARPDLDVRFVAWYRDGFREAPSADAPPAQAAPDRLYRLSGRPWARRLVKALTPLELQLWAWRRFSDRTYSRLADALPPADIRAGDLVVAGDAGWGYDVHACTRRARRLGARVATIAYDLIPVHHPEYCSAAHRRLFEDWLPGALETSDAMLCISAATREELLSYCEPRRLACPPTAAFRLGGELPPAPAAAPRERIRALAARSPFFLCVGSIEARKNHAMLLDAFDACWRGGLAAPLVIVGRPVDGAQATLARIRAHPELGRRLHLVEDCSDAELDFLYRSARAVVLASLAEGFGLPLAEARQRGCEVLASRLPAFEELADEGVRLFAPGETRELAALLSEAAASAPRAGPMPAFTWRDSARQFMDGIARTCGPRTP
jgi:glycosyltransferase involved in cell wall biosynthesis